MVFSFHPGKSLPLQSSEQWQQSSLDSNTFYTAKVVYVSSMLKQLCTKENQKRYKTKTFMAQYTCTFNQRLGANWPFDKTSLG